MHLILGFLILLHCLPLSAATVEGSLLDIRPWSYHNSLGRNSGQLVEFIREVERKTGIKFNIQLKPLKRIIKEIKEQSIDFSILVQREDFKHKVLVLSDVTTFDLFLILPSQSRFVRFDGINTLGLLLGQDVFIKHVFPPEEKPQIIFAKSNKQLYKLLELGRIDAIVSPDIIMNKRLAMDSMPIKVDSIQVSFLVTKQAMREKREEFELINKVITEMNRAQRTQLIMSTISD